MNIEPLEGRIAPAAVVTFTDIDGDSVTVTSSKGTKAQLEAALTLTPEGVGRFSLTLVDLTTNSAVFSGASLSVVAKRGPDGGDGFANVRRVDATGMDIASVKIDGALRELDAGGGLATSVLKNITVHATSGPTIWTLNCSVGALNVRQDLAQSEINISGSSIGAINIGGSLIGSSAVETGHIAADSAKVKSIKILGNVEGGDGDRSGWISAAEIGSLSIGGSLRGGVGVDSAQITAGIFGKIRIGGSIAGGNGEESALIRSQGNIGSILVGGDLQGGLGLRSGCILANAEPLNQKIGSIVIRGSIIGAGVESATINGDEIGWLDVRGRVDGTGESSARIFAIHVKTLRIGSDLRGVGTASGTILVDGVGAGVGTLSIGGSVLGLNSDAGRIDVDGPVGTVTLKGSVVGTAQGSGVIRAETIGSLKISGSVVGGDSSSGSIGANAIKTIAIGGDLTGGLGLFAGTIVVGSQGGIGSVTIGGSMLSSSIYVGLFGIDQGTIGKVLVKGSIIGTSDRSSTIGASGPLNAPGKLAIGSITVWGRVEHAFFGVGGTFGGDENPDAQIGAVKVGGDWIASSIVAGTEPENDSLTGTFDDGLMEQVGEPDALFSKIGSIIIGGMIRGTSDPGDHYGFVAQEIGSLKIGGTAFPLVPGRSNDNVGLTLAFYELGLNFDTTLREV